MDAIVGIIPSNFINAMSENDILAVMFFALFFGIGMLLTPSEKTERLKSVIEGIFEVSMRLIGLVIRLAPLAVFCFMFNLASQFGMGFDREIVRVCRRGVARACHSDVRRLPNNPQVHRPQIAGHILSRNTGSLSHGFLDCLIQCHIANRVKGC